MADFVVAVCVKNRIKKLLLTGHDAILRRIRKISGDVGQSERSPSFQLAFGRGDFSEFLSPFFASRHRPTCQKFGPDNRAAGNSIFSEMASPRTRRVLGDLKPNDENTVRLIFPCSPKSPFRKVFDANDKNIDERLYFSTSINLHTNHTISIINRLIHPRSAIRNEAFASRNVLSARHITLNGYPLHMEYGSASNVPVNTEALASTCPSSDPCRWTSGRTSNSRR